MEIKLERARMIPAGKGHVWNIVSLQGIFQDSNTFLVVHSEQKQIIDLHTQMAAWNIGEKWYTDI